MNFEYLGITAFRSAYMVTIGGVYRTQSKGEKAVFFKNHAHRQQY